MAIGAPRLDHFRARLPPERLSDALRWQRCLARECSLPFVIHCRYADEQCFEVISGWAKGVGRYLGPDREIGMMHCFAGDGELSERYREIGFLISVPGTVTYAKNSRGREMARTLPPASMLVETDCPYLTPQPHRGTRNEPAYVVRTVREVAALHGCTPEEIAAVTAANAARLFGFSVAT